jgi:hypothetical protein
MFKTNEGPLDRIVRAIIGILLLGIAFWLTGWLATLFFVLGIIVLITSATGYCLCYQLCHLSTLVPKTDNTTITSAPALPLDEFTGQDSIDQPLDQSAPTETVTPSAPAEVLPASDPASARVDNLSNPVSSAVTDNLSSDETGSTETR